MRGGKRDLYEGGIRVPFIAHWEGTIAPNRQSNHIGAFWDILPTLADLCNQAPPSTTDGISFLPTLLGEEDQKTHPYLYWEFHEGKGAQAILQDRWKAIRMNVKTKSNPPLILYDLSIDIGETEDVAAKHPEKVKKLEALMELARTPSTIFPLPIDE